MRDRTMSRSILLGLVFLAGNSSALCQNTFIVHLDSAQAGNDAYGRSVFETSGGYLVFGTEELNEGTWKQRCAVYKLHPNGAYESHYLIGSGEPNQLSFGTFDPVVEDEDHGYWAMMYRYAPSVSNAVLVEFDSLGAIISENPVLGVFEEDSTRWLPRQLRRIADGGFIACGGESHGNALLVKVDSTGSVEWRQTYGANGQGYDAISVAEHPNGGYVLAGLRSPGNLTNLGWLIRTDSAGNELWRRFYGNNGGDWAAVRVAADGGIIVYSDYREPTWTSEWRQNLLTKWNEAGQIVWQTRANYYYSTNAYDMEILPDQSIIGVGAYSFAIGLTKYSSIGDSLWTRLLNVFNPQAIHEAYDVEPASDGGFLLTGQASQSVLDPHPGQETIFVIKTDSLGCVVPGCQNVGVQEYVIDLQEQLRVSPNPASDQFNMALDLPQGASAEGEVQVLLLNATGKLVLQQHVEQNFNQLRASMDVSTLPTGTYYLHLRDGKRWLAGSKVVVQH